MECIQVLSYYFNIFVTYALTQSSLRLMPAPPIVCTWITRYGTQGIYNTLSMQIFAKKFFPIFLSTLPIFL